VLLLGNTSSVIIIFITFEKAINLLMEGVHTILYISLVIRPNSCDCKHCQVIERSSIFLFCFVYFVSMQSCFLRNDRPTLDNNVK